MNHSLRAEKRGNVTARRLRREGKVPGVIYGPPKEGAELIAVDEQELLALLRSHPSGIVDVAVEGEPPVPALIAEVQRDDLTGKVLHVDFRRVNASERITVPVRVVLVGDSPAEREGGVVQLIRHELEVSCLPRDLPESIRVDISNLGIGDHLVAADVALPAGVDLADDPDTVVVVALAANETDGDSEKNDSEKNGENGGNTPEDGNTQA